MKRQKIKRYEFSLTRRTRKKTRPSILKVAGTALLVLCVAAGALLGTGRMPGQQATGWKGKGHHRYFVSTVNGMRVKGLYEIDQKLYYFGENGFVKTKWISENGFVGYADENGELRQGESTVDGRSYYFQPGTGQLYTGWVVLNGETYCFDETGHPRTGTYQEDGETWELDAEGRVKGQLNGWKTTDGVLKYYDETGSPAQGWLQIEGRDYLFADGISQAGWVETDAGRRYLDGNGNQMTGWCVIDGQPYAFAADGSLKQGWDHSHGKYYYFSDGISLSGSFQEGRTSYNLNGSGGLQPVGEIVPEEDLSEDAEGEAPEPDLLEEQPAVQPETPAGKPETPQPAEEPAAPAPAPAPEPEPAPAPEETAPEVQAEPTEREETA